MDNLNCSNCGHYEIYQMITSGKPYGYSGDIPCVRCCRYKTVNDEHTSTKNLNLETNHFYQCNVVIEDKE